MENNELISSNSNGLQVYDISKGLPDLTESEPLPFDLMGDYWTPTKEGESKKVFFDKIQTRHVKDMQNEDVVLELECAFFLEKIKGEIKTVCNGSKRLVGALQSNDIERGTPLLITYLGKKKNSTNSYHSDQWSVKPLIINL